MPSEGKNTEQPFNDDIGLASDFGDCTFAFNFSFEIGDGGGGNGIVRRDIVGANDSSKDDGLPVITNGDVAGSLNHHQSVGQNFHDVRGKIDGEGGTEG